MYPRAISIASEHLIIAAAKHTLFCNDTPAMHYHELYADEVLAHGGTKLAN